MNKLCVFLAILGVSLAAPRVENIHNHNYTRFRPTIGGRIVGGDEADISELPYQAALLRNGAQICGGTLIADDVILTAAHCVAASVITSVSQLSFRVGSSQWRTGGQIIPAEAIISHENYCDSIWCDIEYDIAIVTLTTRATVANAIPAQLPPANQQYLAGTIGIVSGWGVTSQGSSISPENLRKVEVPVVAEQQCRQVYGNVINERTVCAGLAQGGKDSCQGDSGGPYVINGQLAGVVSFGAGCAVAGYPGVYTAVSAYRDWISQHVNL